MSQRMSRHCPTDPAEHLLLALGHAAVLEPGPCPWECREPRPSPSLLLAPRRAQGSRRDVPAVLLPQRHRIPPAA